MSSSRQASSNQDSGSGAGSDDDDDDDDDEDQINYKNEDMIFNPESGLRKWLKKHGKEHCIDFEDEELR